MLRKRASLAAILLLIAAPVFAQRFTAAIRGTVTDPSAAAVAGAKVTLTNENTGLTRGMTTNAAGNYAFDDLPVGSYKIEVEFAGFKSAVRSKVVINVADVRAVNITLETGAITESVSVDADSASIKTVGAEIAGLVTGEQVRELPLNGRNFLQLTLLQPGVTANAGPQHREQGPGGRLGHLGQRRLDHVEPLADRRRRQRGPRLQPHDHGLPLGRRDRGVQDPAQQLRRRVRPGRRRAGQPRDPRRDEPLPRQRATTTSAGTRSTRPTTSWSRPDRRSRRSSGTTGAPRSAVRSSRTSCTSSCPTRRTRTRGRKSAAGFVPTRGREGRRLQPARPAWLRAAGPERPLDRPAVPGQRDPGQPDLGRRASRS